MEPKVLLIEDDAPFRKTAASLFGSNGFCVVEARSGKEGVGQASGASPDLIVLDLVMPGMQGLEVCQALKQEPRTAGIPILILTGHDKEGQDVSCLDMGADAYLTKPVKADRLLSHCRALLRRVPGARGEDLRVGELSLDHARKVAAIGRTVVSHLTPKEFEVLYELAAASPEPRDRERLYREVWGMEPPSEGSLKTVDVHVRRLRLKMGWRSDQWLVTVTGRGWALVAP